jgi:hypothetical protein
MVRVSYLSVSSPAAATNAAAAANYHRPVCIQPRLPAATLSKKEVRRYKSIASKSSRSAASPRPPALPTGRHPRCHCIDRGAPRSPTHTHARWPGSRRLGSVAVFGWLQRAIGFVPEYQQAHYQVRHWPAPPRLAPPAPRVGRCPLLSRAPRQRHAAFTQAGRFGGERVCGSAPSGSRRPIRRLNACGGAWWACQLYKIQSGIGRFAEAR